MPNEGETIGGHIRAAIALGEQLRKDAAVDKKWLNKVVARLEEVEAFTAKIYKSGSINNEANFASLAANAPGCTCPPGVRDSFCPVHGRKADQ